MNHANEFYARDRAAWRKWLMEHHETEKSVWLVYDKGEHRTMKWEDIVQEALCFGWIDSLPCKREDGRSMIYVSKRKPKGVWSKINKAHIETLQANGLMMPAGLAAIERAKVNGSWDALNHSDSLVMPAELVEALAKDETARVNFNALTDSQKRQVLQWIYAAKRDQTKQARIQQVVRSAQEGRHANDYQKK